MDRPRLLWRAIIKQHPAQQISRALTTKSTHPPPFICTHCIRNNPSLRPSSILRSLRQRRYQSTQPGDQPGFTSIVDNPPQLIRSGRRHKPWGLLVLATIPVTAFILGCWQVQRLAWKTDLIAKFEDRLVKQPLPLPPHIDPDAVKEFDYRRVYARGKFRHDQEMLIGPRMHDGNDGYLVITPLEQTTATSSSSPSPQGTTGNTTILVCRGWIPKDKAPKHIRRANGALPEGEVVVEGLLREPWKKNMFTPDNKPEEGKWYFPDVYQMAEYVNSQPVWIEETMKPDLLVSYDREAKGVPIGRSAEVNLRNNHTQYIFTWFSLSLATSIMLWMVLKKPAGGVSRRIRQNKEW